MPIDLDKLERLEREATPGPWKVDAIMWENDDVTMEAFCMGPAHKVHREGSLAFTAAKKDAEFMSSLRNAAPALIAELRAARKRIAESWFDEAREILAAQKGGSDD